jgi:hypothetical protein
MMRSRRLFLYFLLACAGTFASGVRWQAAIADQGAAPLTVRMEDCKATRPGKITNDTGIFGLLFSGPPKDELTKRGVVEVDGQKYVFYLPKAKAYTVKNNGKKDHDFENTSTLLSIDQKGDGKLIDADGWFANLPVRLGDRMFDVAEIAADGSRIVLKPSKAPLRGAIVGRACPPFSFPTADGKTISRDGFAGKPFLLDIWSIT